MKIVDKLYIRCVSYFAREECEELCLQLFQLSDEVLALSNEVNIVLFDCFDLKKAYLNQRALNCLRKAEIYPQEMRLA